jgi:hypothetical protein
LALLASYSQTIFGSDWSRLNIRAGLRCAPALALPVAVGIATGHPGVGAIMAGGAYSVGFGSFQRMGGTQVWPMLLAALGMGLSSWVGTLAGFSPFWTVAAATGIAFAYGLVSEFSQAAAWVGLQCSIWLVISNGYPAHGMQAFNRGALILAGGLLQTAVVAIWCRVETGGECPGGAAGAGLDNDASRIFAIRAAITLGIAAALYRWSAEQNGYWIPMTALIVLRPDLHQTLHRGVARMAGTMAGALAGTALVMLLPSVSSMESLASPSSLHLLSSLRADLTLALSSQWILGAGLVGFAAASYALFQVNYAYYALFLTGYVVFLLSLAGIGAQAVILHRAMFTAIGGALPLATYWIEVGLERLRRD